MLFSPTMKTAYFKTGYLTKLAAAIEQTYLKSIRGRGLDFVKARHFLYRYYIVKQDLSSWAELGQTCRAATEKFAAGLITAAGQKEYPDQLDYVYERFRTGFYINLFGIRPTPFSDTEISLIEKNLFAGDSYWRFHAYRAICIVFYLYFQHRIDWIGKAEDKFAAVFSGRQTGDIRNYLYGLTHFIICSTNFYQQPPPPEYQKYLAEIHRQKRRLKPEWVDLVLEAALAGKFYGQNVWPAADLEKFIEPHLVRRQDTAYIRSRPGSNLNLSEHTNALLVLLVNDWRFPTFPKNC